MLREERKRNDELRVKMLELQLQLAITQARRGNKEKPQDRSAIAQIVEAFLKHFPEGLEKFRDVWQSLDDDDNNPDNPPVDEQDVNLGE